MILEQILRWLTPFPENILRSSTALLVTSSFSKYRSFRSPFSIMSLPLPQFLSRSLRISQRRLPSLNHPHLRHYTTPSFPTISKCPSPSCSCADTPELPEGLPIDHKSQLNGSMAPYAEQVIVCTGKDDWTSRIEDENSGDNLANDVKELLGRGGVFADVCVSFLHS